MWLNVCFGEKNEEEALVESKWGHVESKLFLFGTYLIKFIDWSVPPCLWALVWPVIPVSIPIWKASQAFGNHVHKNRRILLLTRLWFHEEYEVRNIQNLVWNSCEEDQFRCENHIGPLFYSCAYRVQRGFCLRPQSFAKLGPRTHSSGCFFSG